MALTLGFGRNANALHVFVKICVFAIAGHCFVQIAAAKSESSPKKRPLAIWRLVSHIDSARAEQAFATHPLRFAGTGNERRNLSR
jgi:hypothetical protein